MLRYIYGHDQVVAHFVAQMIPHVGWRGFSNCKAIGIIDEDGKLIAGVVYSNWNPEAATIEISGAALPGKNWLTRETLRRMFGYPFNECHCQMVIMRVRSENERLLRQLAVYGFSFVTVPRMFGRNFDGVVCTLTDDDWANNKFNHWAHNQPRPFESAHPLDVPAHLRKEAA